MIATPLASIVLSVLTLADPQPPDDPQALADFLMQQNAKSMNALASISYDYTEVFDQFSRGKPPYHDERKGVYRGSPLGEYMEVTSAVRTEEAGGKQLGDFLQTDRYVVNLQYLAHWTVDAINPGMIFYRDDKGGFEQRAELELGTSGAQRQHLLAFGSGELPLKEEMLESAARMKTPYVATAKRIADPQRPNLFELEWGYVHPNNKNGRVTTTHRFTLDGDRGYLVTHGENVLGPRVTLTSWDVEPARDRDDGPWYPKSVHFEQYNTQKHPATQPADMYLHNTYTTQIEHVKLNQRFADSEFAIAAMRMPDGNVMCTLDEKGVTTSFYVQAGELIEVESARGTELEARSQELLQQRVEASRDRKALRPPATQEGKEK